MPYQATLALLEVTAQLDGTAKWAMPCWLQMSFGKFLKSNV